MNASPRRPSHAQVERRWAFRLVGALGFAASVVASLGVGECSPGAGGKVAGEACTRTSECLQRLACQSGICAEMDAGLSRDAGEGDDAAESDAP